MPDTSDSLDTILKRATPPPTGKAQPPDEEPDPEAMTVARMDGRYSTLRSANKTLTRLHVIDKAGKVRTLQYGFIDVESRFESDVFTLIFAGTRHWRITVKGHGPDFWRLYDLICLHRLPYLRESTENESKFAAKGETVLTEIAWKDITPEGG